MICIRLCSEMRIPFLIQCVCVCVCVCTIRVCEGGRIGEGKFQGYQIREKGVYLSAHILLYVHLSLSFVV